ncbi:hypothetical protein D3C84_1255100 [compost metagenome]
MTTGAIGTVMTIAMTTGACRTTVGTPMGEVIVTGDPMVAGGMTATGSVDPTKGP